MLFNQRGQIVGASALIALLSMAATPEAAAEIGFEVGPLTVGGAMRVNYIYGDYPDERGEDIGNVKLDTFRVNLGLDHGPVIGAAEYRWYDGYNFLHTGWLGYDFDENHQVQLGLNRTPFGAGPYGISQSYFFDQNYYVGLADDMDMGIKYLGTLGSTEVALAYYVAAQPNGIGSTDEAARYDRDIVPDDDGVGYEERNHFNVRLIQPVQLTDNITSDIGGSFQIGQLKNKGDADDGKDATSLAGALHAITKMGNFTLGLQYTMYDYGIKGSDLVNTGFYDYYQTIAAKGQIPSISLSYYLETPNIKSLDYMLPYAEYSAVLKSGSTNESVDEDGNLVPAQDFEDSHLVTVGTAWARGGWYIYSEVAFSDGNGFIGLDEYTTVGANLDSTWQYRFNINFGYYF